MQKFSPSAGTWSDYSPSVDSGSLFTARELNGETGLQVNATTGPRVMLFFYGLDSAGKPIYLFERKGLDYFWAQITGSSLVSGEAARWLYTFAEVTGQWTTTGRGQLLSGGRTGSAYNSIEAFNPTSGIGAMGSGQTVTSTEFSNGLKLQPIISPDPPSKSTKTTTVCPGRGAARVPVPARRLPRCISSRVGIKRSGAHRELLQLDSVGLLCRASRPAKHRVQRRRKLPGSSQPVP